MIMTMNLEDRVQVEPSAACLGLLNTDNYHLLLLWLALPSPDIDKTVLGKKVKREPWRHDTFQERRVWLQCYAWVGYI